jgi:hypothetical protein
MPTARADSATTYANTAVKIAVLANDSGSSLTILSVTAPANGAAGINGDKTITYTPKTGYTGSDSFKYTIRDSAGKKATATVSVTVQNRPPVAEADNAATVVGTPVNIAVLANDSDPDGHPLKINAVTQPANGAVTVNLDKTLTYTPAPGFTGTDGFAYTVGDGHGGTAKGTVTVTVGNRPPLPRPDVATTDAGTAVQIPVLANDNDPDGHALLVSSVTQPAKGAATIIDGQMVSYTPHSGFTGTDGFLYTASDGRGGSAQAAVTVTVRNRAPVAGSDTGITEANTPIDLPVLANDSDPDGHALTVVAVSQPASGVAMVNPNGMVRYAPATGFTGADGFTYTISDGQGGMAQGAVAITVSNRPPLPAPDAVATNAYTEVVIAVLPNDSDPDNHSLTVSAVTQPAHGSTMLGPGGTVTYRPADGYLGTDRFTYTLSDGHGGTAVGEVTVTVRGLGEPFGDGGYFTDATGWLPFAA